MGFRDNRAWRFLKFKWLTLVFCLFFTCLSFSASKDINNRQLINQVHGVSIRSDASGHYSGTVLINNIPMPFLIDTGATKIAVPASMAYAARLPLGKATQASTANGLAAQRLTHINSFKIGNIEIRNIEASVMSNLDEVLVGMNFLKLFRITQDSNVLTLILSSDDVSTIESVPVAPVPLPQPLIKHEKVPFFSKNEADFKAQYKKPEECYNMKNNATRMHCANAFIAARKAYDALNK